MRLKETRSAGEGLERSCQGTVAGWLASSRPAGGVELLSAWFAGEAYQKHRHDTYAIGVTDSGVQIFDYRGSVHASTPGQVVVLYPDEVHDGRAGTDEGFGYRIVYVEPFLLTDAVRTLCGRPCPLPFVSEPVSTNALLSRAIDAAFRAPLESLAVDSLIVDLAHGLMAGERGGARSVISRRVDVRAIERARQFLDAEKTRVVHSRELESITGLTRYDLSRQFRIMCGTSPYRYLLRKRWRRLPSKGAGGELREETRRERRTRIVRRLLSHSNDHDSRSVSSSSASHPPPSRLAQPLVWALVASAR